MDLRSLIGIDSDINISNITCNSKDCVAGSLFICLKGETVDGHDFVNEAIRNGAVFVIAERKLDIKIEYLIVENSKTALFSVVKKFYDISDLIVIGVTGTDGKTTTSLILKHLLEESYNVGYIGSNGAIYGDETRKLDNTTPNNLELLKTMSEMKQKGANFIIMEVSSHAILEDRIKNISFYGAILTNISHDHLDYHKSLENYVNTKRSFFRDIKEIIALNADDFHYIDFLQSSSTHVTSYGIKNRADFQAKNIKYKFDNSTFTINDNFNVTTNLGGKFNVYNILAAVSIARYAGIKMEDIQKRLKIIPEIKGRQHLIEKNDFQIIIDFAHTANALENLILSVRKMSFGRIILILGACGNRDRLKRPIMGNVAVSLADFVIFTDEDPKNEDPNLIIEDLVKDIEMDNFTIIRNRKLAISLGLTLCKENDVLLITGKGDEDTITYNDKIIYHNDIEFVQRELQ